MKTTRISVVPDAMSAENRARLAAWCRDLKGEKRIGEDSLVIDVTDEQLAEISQFATVVVLDPMTTGEGTR